jgi:hypothetical protein
MRDRTDDQMDQVARSGKQNIIEGRQASDTSNATEIKLTNVARRVGKNCWRIIAIFCVSGGCRNGARNTLILAGCGI